MARLFPTALIMWALCFSAANCGSAKVQGPQTRESKTSESPSPSATSTAAPVPSTAATLTAEQPVSSLPVETAVLKSGAEVLEVTITKVVNPSQTPVSVLVSLAVGQKGTSEAQQISVGSFSLYPPDQPGKFLLNAKSALREGPVAYAVANGHPIRLVFEMKRTNETKPWTPVELTIAQPTWRAAEK